jgi:hypothetical protein
LSSIIEKYKEKYAGKVIFVALYADEPIHCAAIKEAHIERFPTIRFIDKTNKITFEKVGFRKGDETMFKEELDKISK